MSFQSSAVKKYLNSAQGKQAHTGYANGRAYPDVAFLGSDYVLYIGGFLADGVSGTSASAPAFAGMSKIYLCCVSNI